MIYPVASPQEPIMTADLCWKQRFQNFDRALVLLREPVERDLASLSALEQEGTIQRFAFAVELARKTLKGYLEHEGRPIQPVTPHMVIKEAFAAQIIADGQVWVDMVDHRNLLSHTYDSRVFTQTLGAVRDRYLAAFEQLHEWLLVRAMP